VSRNNVLGFCRITRPWAQYLRRYIKDTTFSFCFAQSIFDIKYRIRYLYMYIIPNTIVVVFEPISSGRKKARFFVIRTRACLVGYYQWYKPKRLHYVRKWNWQMCERKWLLSYEDVWYVCRWYFYLAMGWVDDDNNDGSLSNILRTCRAQISPIIRTLRVARSRKISLRVNIFRSKGFVENKNAEFQKRFYVYQIVL